MTIPGSIQTKLGFFHPSFASIGGAEVLVEAQARELRNRDFDVCVVTRAWEPRPWTPRFEGISVRFVPRISIVDAMRGPIGRMRKEAERAASVLADRQV